MYAGKCALSKGDLAMDIQYKGGLGVLPACWAMMYQLDYCGWASTLQGILMGSVKPSCLLIKQDSTSMHPVGQPSVELSKQC